MGHKHSKSTERAAQLEDEYESNDSVTSWQQLLAVRRRPQFITNVSLSALRFDCSNEEPFTHTLYSFLEKCHQLLSLSLVECELDHFPYYLPTEIQFLNLTSNKISNLPQNFGLFRDLKELNLSNNFIRFLGQDLLKNSRIELLNFSGNQIEKVLKKTFGVSKTLKALDLSCNLISSIEFELSDFPALESLNLSYNNLNSIPATFFDLSSPLRVFVLSANPIHDLPNGLWKLKNLESFEEDGVEWRATMQRNDSKLNIILPRVFKHNTSGQFYDKSRSPDIIYPVKTARKFRRLDFLSPHKETKNFLETLAQSELFEYF